MNTKENVNAPLLDFDNVIIEKDIPIPKSIRNSTKYQKIREIFKKMEPGDSIIISKLSPNEIKNYISSIRTTLTNIDNDHKPVFKRVLGGTRLWKVAK